MAGILVKVLVQTPGYAAENRSFNLRVGATVSDLKNKLHQEYEGGNPNLWRITQNNNTLENQERVKGRNNLVATYTGQGGSGKGQRAKDWEAYIAAIKKDKAKKEANKKEANKKGSPKKAKKKSPKKGGNRKKKSPSKKKSQKVYKGPRGGKYVLNGGRKRYL